MILNSADIDKIKWDDCIQSSNDPLFYFLYDVITAATNGLWLGEVYGDYQDLFPIPLNKKYGFTYFYTPAWIQRLGWHNHVANYLPAPIKSGKWVDIMILEPYTVGSKPLSNYILDLKKPLQYSENHKRNIKKAKNNGYTVTVVPCNSTVFVEFFKNNKGINIKNVNTQQYLCLQKIIDALLHKNLVVELCVLDTENKPVARGLMVGFGKRFTYFKGASGNHLKNSGVAHLLLHHAIELAIEKQYPLFDFYGGNSAGMKQFYKGFGATEEVYFHYQKKYFNSVYLLAKKIGL